MLRRKIHQGKGWRVPGRLGGAVFILDRLARAGFSEEVIWERRPE